MVHAQERAPPRSCRCPPASSRACPSNGELLRDGREPLPDLEDVLRLQVEYLSRSGELIRALVDAVLHVELLRALVDAVLHDEHAVAVPSQPKRAGRLVAILAQA